MTSDMKKIRAALQEVRLDFGMCCDLSPGAPRARALIDALEVALSRLDTLEHSDECSLDSAFGRLCDCGKDGNDLALSRIVSILQPPQGGRLAISKELKGGDTSDAPRELSISESIAQLEEATREVLAAADNWQVRRPTMSETKGVTSEPSRPSRESAAGVIERKITRLKKELEGLEALKALADTLEVGSVAEQALWKMISVVI